MALKIRKHDYYVSLWKWDAIKQEYYPQVVIQTNDEDNATEVYNNISTSIDVPLVELWKTNEDIDERLNYKEA